MLVFIVNRPEHAETLDVEVNIKDHTDLVPKLNAKEKEKRRVRRQRTVERSHC